MRALAVVPVILFHAGYAQFGGGFVGVDVFFVISGYLITSIIAAELQAGRFSLLVFYERRARRILPALFFVLLACLPLAWIWLTPEEMTAFSRSLVAVPLFASNFLFWQQSGYFDTASELKPLLHTWSLAVEEQYYLLFPLLLMAVWKGGRRWVQGTLVVGALASLALAVWGVGRAPSAAFFLLPTRAWELLLGSCTALLLMQRPPASFTPRLAQGGSLAGLAMLLYAIFAFDKYTPFPGLHALVPTVGAALLIVFASPHNLAGRLLGTRLFVGIGLVSYSAYLWHQPVFAFARYGSPVYPNGLAFIGLIALTFVLAGLTWKFIEAPFRQRQRVARPWIFTGAVAGSVLLVALGLLGQADRGLELRLGKDQLAFLRHFENSYPEWQFTHRMRAYERNREACNFYDIQQFMQHRDQRAPRPALQDDCHLRDSRYPQAVFIWGDSHAQQLHHGLQASLPPSWQILQVASSGCSPKLVDEGSTTDYCQQSNFFARTAILKARPDVVVMAQDRLHSADKMRALSQDLLAAGIRKVVLVGPSPHWDTGLPRLMAMQLWHEQPRRTTAGLDQSALKTDQRLKREFKSSPAAVYVSMVDFFCDAGGCLTYLGEDLRSGITCYDRSHMSYPASEAFARAVLAPAVVSGP